MLNLHQITCFRPIKLIELNQRERKRELYSLIFLVKKDRRIKSRTCANGGAKITWMQK